MGPAKAGHCNLARCIQMQAAYRWLIASDNDLPKPLPGEVEETVWVSRDLDLEVSLRFNADEDDREPAGGQSVPPLDMKEDVHVDEDAWPHESADGESTVDEIYDPLAAYDDEDVDPIEMYLPLLLQRKFGDNWEDVLSETEAEYGEELYSDDDEDDEYTEEQLRQMINEQREREAAGFDSERDETDFDHAMVLLDEATSAQEETAENLPEHTLVNSLFRPQEAALANEALEEMALEGIELSDELMEWVAEDPLTDPAPGVFPASEWLTVFACAVQPMRFQRMKATYANLRVLCHVNFADFAIGEDGRGELETADRALLKAQAVFLATGLPAIAESMVMYIAASGNKPQSEMLYEPGEAMEGLISRFRPISEADRPVIYCASTAFVSENVTLQGYGEVEFPMLFASAERMSIAQSAAHDGLFKKVSDALDLPFVGNAAFDEYYELSQQQKKGLLRKKTAGALLLKEKIMREATVLAPDILKVSSFLNHLVDVELMEACGEELAERLQHTQPNKVLTVEATGLLPSMFVGKALDLPVLFARKSRQIGVSDSYQVSYKSHMQKAQDLYVSTEHLNPGDRVIIIDDFLAGGTTADALIRVCRMANANVVGGGFLIEKVSDAGRAFLSGYCLPLESIVHVSIDKGTVHVHDNEPDDEVYEEEVPTLKDDEFGQELPALEEREAAAPRSGEERVLMVDEMRLGQDVFDTNDPSI
eukprot:CAMPEP_0119299936 /NCGR_PEP_ID=MMETSP1333-20130426/1930_1 /TAXON_ID=418940 /ORGANISM="Scyphosphaera apsteinii, Strain RCC1455" /LENGTH=708 /DNA_ID=CAMNT_0007301545 /DNA_START=102 /DNA_END=2229 /DNA_ORIENTATION=+